MNERRKKKQQQKTETSAYARISCIFICFGWVCYLPWKCHSMLSAIWNLVLLFACSINIIAIHIWYVIKSLWVCEMFPVQQKNMKNPTTFFFFARLLSCLNAQQHRRQIVWRACCAISFAPHIFSQKLSNNWIQFHNIPFGWFTSAPVFICLLLHKIVYFKFQIGWSFLCENIRFPFKLLLLLSFHLFENPQRYLVYNKNIVFVNNFDVFYSPYRHKDIQCKQ